MSIVLYHHPFSRAATVVWMLEEVGVDYELKHIDLMKGAHKAPELMALNPMGKLPILTDGDAVVTESAAIGLYLADRYAPGRLAPALDSSERAAYLRWSLFSPSVIEPGLMAKAAGWNYKEVSAGWGEYGSMLKSMQVALEGKNFVLGDTFSMADIIFGGTVRFMLRFKLLEELPVFTQYAERLGARPACQKAEARNAAITEELGLARG